MDAAEFYSENADDFHLSYRSDANRLERMRIWRDFLDRYAAGAAFAYDIGCGSGVLACELARRGIETVGIDGAEAMLAIAEKTARHEGLANLHFQQGHLPIADTTGYRPADIVISSSVIEYLDSIPESLRFLRNLLGDNGVVIFSVPNRDSVSRRIARLIHRITGRPRYLGYLRHVMDIEGVRADLSASDLTYLEHAYFARADRLNRFLRYCLPLRQSSNMIIVVARRKPGK